MNPTRTALALLVLATVAYAGFIDRRVDDFVGKVPYPENGVQGGVGRSVNALYPSAWLQKIVDNVPKVDDITFTNLIHMPVDAATALLKTVFQHSYLHPFSGSLYVPNFNQIKMYLITANGNVSVPLNNPQGLRNYPQLSTGEVSIFVTGLPSNSEDPSDAATELIEAYRARYELSDNQYQYTNSWDAPTSGSLIVIDLGNYLNSFKKWITLDVEQTGEAIGQAIVAITEFVPYYNIHMIGHSVAAHVVGVAARYVSQEKGQQLRRVTGLDPSKIFTRQQHIQSELNRGVADFVDIIHSTSYGAGAESNGDADFYPNGPGSVAPGSDNILDASLKSIRYYAETVLPGNERNLMAVECNSLKDYENQRCHGIRVPMGHSAPQDSKGNFVLRVNPKSPYGRNARRLGGNANRDRNGLIY